MTIVPSQGGCESGCGLMVTDWGGSLSNDGGVNDVGCKCEKQCTYANAVEV